MQTMMTTVRYRHVLIAEPCCSHIGSGSVMKDNNEMFHFFMIHETRYEGFHC